MKGYTDAWVRGLTTTMALIIDTAPHMTGLRPSIWKSNSYPAKEAVAATAVGVTQDTFQEGNIIPAVGTDHIHTVMDGDKQLQIYRHYGMYRTSALSGSEESIVTDEKQDSYNNSKIE